MSPRRSIACRVAGRDKRRRLIVATATALVLVPVVLGQAQAPQPTITKVGWYATGTNEKPLGSVSGVVPDTTTRAVFEYGPNGPEQPVQTTAARLELRPGASRAYTRLELRFGVLQRVRLVAETNIPVKNAKVIANTIQENCGVFLAIFAAH